MLKARTGIMYNRNKRVKGKIIVTTLDEVLKAVDRLSADELLQLQQYVTQRQRSELTTDKASALDAAIQAMREGLTEHDLDEIEWAMNVEFIKPIDKE
jgi:hypothetical protein